MQVAALALATACRGAVGPAAPTPHPAAAPAAAPATSPVAARPALTIPADSRVRVTLAGSDGWLEGLWVVTSVGCHGVLLSESRLLVLLPTLTAMERAVPAGVGGGDEWQPVPLSQLRDGEGCTPPSDA